MTLFDSTYSVSSRPKAALVAASPSTPLRAERSLSAERNAMVLLLLFVFLGALPGCGGTASSKTSPPIAASVSFGNLAQMYTGQSIAVSVATLPAGLSVSVTYNGSTNAPTAAGSYAVVGTITSAGYTGTASGTLVISKATATVILANMSQTYTGSPLAVTTATSPSGLGVAVSYNGNAVAPTAAGSYPVTATISDPNYMGGATGTLSIAPASVSITLSGLSQTYTGAPVPVTAITKPAGLNVVTTYDGATAVPSAAGTYVVKATVSDPNYAGTANGTLSVAPATASITVSGLSQTYTGAPLVVTTTTNPAGLNVMTTYNGSTVAPTAAGTYGVVANVVSPNYAGSANGTFLVHRAAATVTLGNLNQTFENSPLSVSTITVPAGLPANATYNGSTTPPTNEGSYQATATISNPNYSGSASGTLTIVKPKPVLLWSEDFAGTHLPANWVTNTGTWTANSGLMSPTDVIGYPSFITFDQNYAVENRTFSATFQMLAPGTILGFGSNLNGDGYAAGGSLFTVDGTNNTINIYNSWYAGSNSGVLATEPLGFSLAVGQQYTLTITQWGRAVTASIVDPVSGTSASISSGALSDISPAWGMLLVDPVFAAIAGRYEVENLSIYAESNAPRILFLGDSLTYGVGLSTDQRWMNVASSMTRGQLFTVSGKPGGLSQGVVERSTTELPFIHPAYLFVLTGTNDASLGIPLETFEANINAIISAAQKQGAQVVLATLPPDQTNQGRINSYNSFLETVPGVTLVRFDIAMSENSDGVTPNLDLYQPDGEHPNAAGATAMASRLLSDAPVLFQ